MLTNVLYCGDIAHQAVVYPDEHPALVSRDLWQEVNAKHRPSRTKIRRHRAVDAPLQGLIQCGHCGGLLTASFTQRQGPRYLYYMCRTGKKQPPICPQQPLRAHDLEDSLRERLERRGAVSDLAFEQFIRAVSYHSAARRVSVELQDGNRFEFCLPVPVRPGVRRPSR